MGVTNLMYRDLSNLWAELGFTPPHELEQTPQENPVLLGEFGAAATPE